jgi:hypothetical protein
LTTELAVSNAKAALEKERDQFKAEFSNSKIAKHLAVDNALADINC